MNVNPERLILAREVRGITQPKLAEITGIDQGAISRFEGGLKSVSDNDLNLIAQALEFPVAFFFRPGERHGAESGELFHRKRHSLPAGHLRRIHAQLNILRLNIERILEEVEEKNEPYDIPSYNVREFGGDIESIAAAVRAAWKMPPGPVTNLVRRLERAYCFVHTYDFNTNLIDETTQWCEPTPPVILVNMRAPGDRLRYSLAHALGHLVLHHNVDPHPEMEREADEFAAAFLMPAEEIRDYFYPMTIEHLLQLKPSWKVSVQALIRRALDLGVINKTKYTSLFQMLSRAGYRKAEPFPLDPEEPKSFTKILTLYQEHRNYTIREMAEQVLAISERDFRDWYLPNEPHLTLVKSKKQDAKGGYQSG